MVTASKTPNQVSSDADPVTFSVTAAFKDANTAAGANHDTLTYTATGLPKGLTLNPTTGVISGTIDKSASIIGGYTVAVTASDGKGGTVTETFSWSVANKPPVTAATLGAVSAHDSSALSIPVAAGFSDPLGLPLSFAATGLPAGFQIDPKTGVITGTLDHNASVNVPGGVYHVTVTADDGQGGKVSQTFDLTSTNDTPVVSNVTPTQLSTNGASVIVSTSGAFSDPNTGDKLTYSALNGMGVSTLPAGLSIDPATGVISGTLDKSASVHGPFTVSITATDNKGLATSETFTWNVDNLPPQATPALPAQAVYDSQGFALNTATGFQNPLGLPLTYSVTGLPDGLTMDANGNITGAIDHNASQSASGGVYTVAVTVDDGQGGIAVNTFTITATNQAPVVSSLTPDQSSSDADPVSFFVTAAFNDPNTGDTLTYSASGLPPGLAINSSTGEIKGVIDTSASVAGTYTVTVYADDGKGGVTPETFTWTVANVPPTATPIDDATVSDGAPIALLAGATFTDPIGVPLTFTAAGLPKGLTFDPKTGTISGTIDHDASVLAPGGVYSVTVTASDGQGGTVSETFTITSVNAAPDIVNPTKDQTGSNGGAVSLNVSTAFTDINTGDKIAYGASGLPDGLTIDAKTGLISGTIDALASKGGPSSNGTYTITITATDDKGAVTTETIKWSVDSLPLSVSPIPDAAVNDSQTVSLDVSASFASPLSLPLTFSAADLPNGLSIDPITGVISGTMDHDASQGGSSGAYSVTITATDGQSTINKTFTITSANQAPDVANVTPDQGSTNGETVSFDVSGAFLDPNTGDAVYFSAAGLPPGLSIDKNGVISGTIDKSASLAGSYSVTITATDEKGATTIETFTWTVGIVPPEVIATVPNALVKDSQHVTIDAGSTIVDPIGLPLTFTATGLPKGLAIDPKTGVITGAIDHDASAGGSGGVYTITVTASDGLGGTVDQTFTIQSVNQPPDIVASTPDQSSKNNGAVSLDASAAFKDPNSGDTLTFAAANLPPGLSIDPQTGLVTGTIATNASVTGPYTVSITATDDKGVSTTETFTWTVDNVPPVATIALPAQTVQDGLTIVSLPTAAGFKDPIGLTLTYSATGLPKGLSIDPTTGVISGTLDHDASLQTAGGVYSVVVTVDDGQGGKAVNAFNMVSTNQAPEVVDPTPPQITDAGKAVTFDVSSAFADPNVGADTAANHDKLTFKATGLPPGLGIDPDTGVIVGTIDPHAPKIGNIDPLTPSVGVFTVTVTATDEKGASVSETFTWTVNDVPPVPVGAIATYSAPDSTTGIAIDTAANFTSPIGLTLSYSATDLPPGFMIDPTTGKITGVLDHDASKNAPSVTGANGLITGAYTVTITADDGQGGKTTQTLLIEATNQAPTHATSTPNQTSNAGSPVTLDTGKVFSDPNTGDILTYAADIVPPGLTFDTATGKFSGTLKNTAVGAYTITVTATDDKGAANSETFTWTAMDVPPAPVGTLTAQSFPDSTTGISIPTATGFSSPIGLPLTYSASGLPTGLAINTTTGEITGHLQHDASSTAPSQSGAGATLDGKYTITVSVDDGFGGKATQTLIIDATNTAPAVGTATATQTSNAGDTSVSVATAGAFSDANTGDTLTYAATGLPPGLSINATTGEITGNIAATATATYSAKVTATDDKGAKVTETFTWTVKDVPPVTHGAVTAVSYPDSATITAIDTAVAFSSPIGLTLTYSAVGLPTGLSINTTTGKITGTIDHNASKDAPATSGAGATLDGTYTVVVTANDGYGGKITQTFTIDATNTAPGIVANTTGQTGSAGDANVSVDASAAFTDPNTGDVLTYSASGLPTGLTINATTGKINGTIANTATGSYDVTVTAKDNKGATTAETFTWTVNDVPPKPVGTLTTQTFPDSTTGISIATAGGFSSPIGLPLTYSATGLPDGLSINATTGKITGNLLHDASSSAPSQTGVGATLDGKYTVVVTVNDGYGGKAAQTLFIDATNTAPAVGTATTTQTNNAGDKTVSLATAGVFSDANTGDTLTYSATGLPPGLTINAATGKITGDIAATGTATYTVKVTATDDKGAQATETFTWTVKDVPPTPNTTLTAQSLHDGGAVSIDVSGGFTSPIGLPLTYTASGLPPGLSIDATGKIIGTMPTNASVKGPYTVTVTVDDGYGGTATQTFTLTGLNVPPVAAPDSAGVLQGKTVTISPLANDASIETDAAGHPVTLTLTSVTALHGTVTINPDGKTVIYTPDPAYFGSETITYTVSDGQGGVSTSTVAVQVYEQPAAPQVTQTAPTPALPLPAHVPFVHVDGAVLDTVRAAGGPVGITGTIGAGGPVLAAVNGILTLNGSGLSETGPIIAQILPHNRLSELAALSQRLEGDHPIDLAGLTGFSLHFQLNGGTESSSGGGQLIVETLVRERQLLIQVSNTFAAVGLHVSEYRVFQADGRPLPSWLSTAEGGLVLGEAPPSEETIQLRVIAILDDDSTEERYVTIQTRTGEIQPLAEDQHSELPRLFHEKLGRHTTLAASEIVELARWLAA